MPLNYCTRKSKMRAAGLAFISRKTTAILDCLNFIAICGQIYIVNYREHKRLKRTGGREELQTIYTGKKNYSKL